MSQAAFSAPGIEQDYVLWLEHQIELIRERRFAQLDVENLLDDLEYSVSKHKRGLRSRLRVLILHLIKCEYQPVLRSNSWISTLCTQRAEIEDALEDSPSLRHLVPSYAQSEYMRAVRQAVKETGLPMSTFPTSLPYTEQQLLDIDVIP